MIQSVARAVGIIHAFTPAEPRLSLAEISGRVGLPKTTTHNLLSTLHSLGLVEKTDDGRYALGKALVSLSQSVRVTVEFRDRAAPLLRDLADISRESVYLAVQDGDRLLYIYAIESPRRLLARTAVGDHALLHCTSVGKAILACLPDNQVEGILQRSGLPAFTEATITDRQRLWEELALTRSRGYAVDRGEHEKATYCVGAAIRDQANRVVGSCSVSGDDPEIAGNRASHLSALVLYTAQAISRHMGYVPAKVAMVVEAAAPILADGGVK